MAQFDEDKQKQKLADIRSREEEDLAEILSEKYSLPYADLTILPIASEALRLIKEEEAREANIAPFAINGKKVNIGTNTPDDPKTKEAIEGISSRGYTPKLFFVSNPGLEHAWEVYKDLSFSTETRAGVLEISVDNIAHYMDIVNSLEDAKAAVKDELESNSVYRVTRIIEALVASALALGASDIHIEPEDERVRLRFRLDGLLSDVHFFDTKTYNMLLSRLKLLSGLKLNLEEEAQDGRFTISLGEREVEVRASILPGENGESVVMRVLDPDTLMASINSLGMHPTALEIMKREVQRPNGMILNTGPTGSGKTTTLYAFLKHIQNPEMKVITIENPVEYHLEGIVQTQTSDEGLSFAEGLRSIVRQDPDIIMVGEIRDTETASIAVRSAMTGHLVFSTLHTNTAAGTFPRLIDLEIEPKALGSALNVAMSQRLVRLLCEHCRRPVELSSEEKTLAESHINKLPDNVERPEVVQKYEAVGCEECGGRGYKGRTGIFEIIVVDDDIEQLLHEKGQPSEREILAISEKKGILNIKQDAILKILAGTTTFDEVQRVIDL